MPTDSSGGEQVGLALRLVVAARLRRLRWDSSSAAEEAAIALGLVVRRRGSGVDGGCTND